MNLLKFIYPRNRNRGMIDISYFVIIGVIAVIIIYIAVALFSAFNNRSDNKTKPVIPSTSVRPMPTSQLGSLNPKLTGTIDKNFYPEIAQNLLKWIDEQKTPNGLFISRVACSKDKCEQKSGSKPTGSYVLWAHYQHYLKTKSSLDIDAINKIITVHLDPEIIRTLQNAFWGCKLLYEVTSSNLPEILTMKDRLIQYCKRNINNPAILRKIDTVITNKTARDPDIEALAEGRVSPPPASTDDYIELALLSAEYTSRFRWFSDPIDLERAKQLFKLAAAMYDPNNRQITGNTAALGIAALDLYIATGNNSYKVFANRLAAEKIAYPCNELYDCALTAIFAHSFSSLDPQPQYISLETQSLSNAVSRGYDKKGYEGYLMDNGAFHMFSQNETTNYIIQDNALMAGILLQH